MTMNDWRERVGFYWDDEKRTWVRSTATTDGKPPRLPERDPHRPTDWDVSLDWGSDDVTAVITPRRALLEEAADLVDGDRNAQYGDPRQDFQRTAAMWAAYLGVDIEPHDVAAMMSLLKVSRIRWSPGKRDSWVDLAGYAACGWHCAMPDE